MQEKMLYVDDEPLPNAFDKDFIAYLYTTLSLSMLLY